MDNQTPPTGTAPTSDQAAIPTGGGEVLQTAASGALPDAPAPVAAGPGAGVAPAPGAPTPPPQANNPSPKIAGGGWQRWAILGAAGLILLIGLGAIGYSLINGRNQQAAKTNQQADKVQATTVDLADLRVANTDISGQQVDINGLLRINNQLVLTPGTRPQSPAVGQMYLDSSDQTMYFWDGTSWISLGLGAAAAAAAAAEAGGGVESLQGTTGDINLVGTNGLSVSTGGTNITFALPQNLAITANPQFVNLNLTGLNPNEIIYSNGTSLTSITPAGDGLCLVSQAGAPTFGSCVGGAAVASLNGGTGILSIAYAPGGVPLNGTVTIQDASATLTGVVNAGAQTFGGNKTFNGNVQIGSSGGVLSGSVGAGLITVPGGEEGKLCTSDLGVAVDDDCYSKFASASGSGEYIQFAPDVVQVDGTCWNNPACTTTPTNTIWVGKTTTVGDILHLQGVAADCDPTLMACTNSLQDALVLKGDGTMFFRSLVNDNEAFQIQNAATEPLMNISTVPVPNLLDDPTFDIGSTLPILPDLAPDTPDPNSGTGSCISPACWTPIAATGAPASTIGWDRSNSVDTTTTGNGSLKVYNSTSLTASQVSGVGYPKALVGLANDQDTDPTGTQYTITAYGRAIEQGRTPQKLYAGPYYGANLDGDTDCARIPTTNLNIYGYAWFKYQCTFTVPIGSTTGGVYFRTATKGNAGGTAGIYWLDKMIIQEGVAAPIANGRVEFNLTPLKINFSGEEAFVVKNEEQNVEVINVDSSTGHTTINAVADGPGVLTVNSSDQQYILRLDSGASGTTTNRWQTGTPLPTRWLPYQSAQVTTGGKTYAYLAGGDACVALTGACGLAPTDKVYYSELAAGGNGDWVPTTNLPVAVTNQAVVEARGYLYVIGGSNDGSSSVGTVYYNKINSVTGELINPSWTTSSATGFTPRMDLKAIYYNGYIYAIGGSLNGSGTIYTTVERAKVNADGSLGNWTADDSLPVGANRKAFGIAQSGGYLYVIGGIGNSGHTNTIIYTQVGSGGDLSSWSNSGTTLPNVPGDNGNRGFTMAAVSTTQEGAATLYVLGGRTAAPPSASAGARYTAFFSQIDSTTGDVGSFTTSYITDALNATYPRIMAGIAMKPVDNTMFMFGGTLGGGNNRSETVFVTLNGTPNNAYVGGTLNVTSGAKISGDLLVKPVGSDSASLIDVQNLAKKSIFKIDTLANITSIAENNSAEIHNWSLNQSALPAPGNSGLGSTIVNGYAYAIGGESAEVRYAKVNADGSLGDFATTNTPAGWSGYNKHNMVTSANGFIYILGGITPGSEPAATNDIYFAKPNADGTISNWREASSAVESSFPAVGGAAVAVYNNTLYVVGGATSSTSSGTVLQTPNTTDIVRYAHINSDGTLNPFVVDGSTFIYPSGIMGAQAVVSNGYLYVTGGNNGVGYEANVAYIKLAANGTPVGPSWASSSTGSLARAYHGSFIANGYIYIVGGRDANVSDQVIYGKLKADGDVENWDTQDNASLRFGVYDFGYAFANGYFYIIGGKDDAHADQTVISYGTTSRVKVGGSLDLVGFGSKTLSDAGGGGLLTAGNTTIVGTLDVRDTANFTQSVVVGGNLTTFGNFLLQTGTNSTTAFQVQNANGVGVATIDTSGGLLQLGYYDSGTPANSVNGALVFANSNDANTLTLQAPAGGIASSFTLTLPNADGTADECLKTDGSGVLSFAACETGSGPSDPTKADADLGNIANVAIPDGEDLLPANAGMVNLGSALLPFGQAFLTGSNYTANTVLAVTTGAADNVGVAVKAAVGQTANIQEWQNSSGTALAAIKANGDYVVGTGANTTTLKFTAPSGNKDFTFDTVGGTVCTSLNIGTCGAGGGGVGAFVQGGNAFGTTAILGTTDANGLQIKVGGVSSPRAYFDTTGKLFLGNPDNTGSATTPTAFTIQGTNTSTAATAGGNINIFGGTSSTSGNGGNIVLSGGTRTSGLPGGVVIRPQAGQDGTTALTAFVIQNAATNRLLAALTSTVTENNTIAVGAITSPVGQLYVSGIVPSASIATLNPAMLNPRSFVSGRFMYVVSGSSSSPIFVKVYDISNPASPVQLGCLASSATGGCTTDANVKTANDVILVGGRYLYVANSTASPNGGIDIYDVANPSAPTKVGGTTAVGGLYTNATSLRVQGKYLYAQLVGNLTASTLQVFDISNPIQPVSVGLGGWIDANNSHTGLAVRGNYAYLTNTGTGSTFRVVDISNPASPTSVGTLAINTNGAPSSVVLKDKYAYVTDNSATTPSVVVVDISNPASPTAAATYNYPSGQPRAISIQDRYAYVVANDSTMRVIDLYSGTSAPTTLTSVGTVATSANPIVLQTQGRYAFVTHNNTGNVIRIYDIGGTYTQQLEAGGIETDDLVVSRNANVLGNLNLQGGLVAGRGLQVQGDSSFYGSSIGINSPTGTTTISSSNLLSGNTTGFTLQSGNASNGNSGSITIDVGTATGGTRGTINIGVTNPTSGINIGNATQSGGVNINAGLLSSGLSVDNGNTSRLINVDSNTTQNLVGNGGFDSGLSGWGALSTAALFVDSLQQQGQFSMRIAGLGADNGARYPSTTGTFMGTGTQYTLSFWARHSSGSMSDFEFGRADAYLGSQTFCQTGVTLTTTWTYFTCTFTTGTVSGGGYIYFKQTGSGVRTYLIDAVQLELGSTATIFNPGGQVQLLGTVNSPVTVRPKTDTSQVFQVQTSAGANVLNVDTANARVSVGSLGSSNAQLYVSGSNPTSATGTGTSGTTPREIKVQGRYAYVINQGSNTLAVYDANTPTTMSGGPISTVATGSSPIALAVQGRYAYVANFIGATLQVFDISNPSSISSVGSVVTNVGPRWMAIRGRYLYLTNFNSFGGPGTFQIFDISNPASPVGVSSIATGNSTRGVFVQGNYAYVINSGGPSLQIINIANPNSPSTVSTTSVGTIPWAIYVQDRYAYIVDQSTSQLLIWDISNPSSPSAVSTVSTGTQPQSLYIQQNRAYVANTGGTGIRVIDITNPASPTSLGDIGAGAAPISVFVSGRYAYTTLNGGGIEVYDIGGAYIQQLSAGGIEASTLSLRGSAVVAGDISIQGGVHATGSIATTGNLGVGGNAAIQGTLSVAGGIQGGLSITGISAPSAPTITPGGTPGSTTYEYTITAVSASGGESTASSAGQTTTGNATLSSTNFNAVTWSSVAGALSYKVYRVTSGGTPSSTGLIGTTSGLTLYDTGLAGSGSSPTTNTTGNVSINGATTITGNTSVTGDVLFKPTSNGPTSFQVQNASGAEIIVVNSSTKQTNFYGPIQFAGSGYSPSVSVAAQTVTDTNGAGLNVLAATGNGTGAGGTLLVRAGQGGTTGNGGSTNIAGGNSGSGGGNGGDLNLVGGASGGGGGNGGNVIIAGGAKNGAGTDGSVIVRSVFGNTTNAFQVQDSSNAEVLIANTTDHTIVVKGKSGQTADLLQVQNSSGTALSFFDSTGSLRVGSSASNRGSIVDGLHSSVRANATDQFLKVQVNGDTNNRFEALADGKLLWGSGSATPDIALSRSGAGGLLLQGTSDSQTAFQVKNAAGTNSLLTVDSTNLEVSVGAPPSPSGSTFNVYGGLNSVGQGPGYEFNARFSDSAAAAQGVGGGIAFGGNADQHRIFAVIQGYHESASASDYAGALRFLTRPSGQDPIQVLNIDSTGLATFASNIQFAVGSNHTLTVANQTASDTDGNDLTVGAANGLGTGDGGSLVMGAGTGGATGDGGDTIIAGGGGGATSGNGGNLVLSGGAANANNDDGGNLYLFNGNKHGSGTTGSIVLKPQASNDTANAVLIQDAGGTSYFTADSSTRTITVTNLTVSTLLTVNGHIVSGGSTPTASAGALACTSPPTPTVSGTDVAGTVTITTGTGCSGPSGSIVQINFATTYGAAPKGIVVTPNNDKASALDFYVDSANTTNAHFTIDASNPPLVDSTVYKFNYIVIQ